MKRTLIAIAAVATFALPTVSFAKQPRQGGYVSAFIGASVPTDTDVDSLNITTNSIFTTNDRVGFDPGINIGGTAGYDFGLVRLEGEMSFKQSEISSVTEKGTGFQFLNPDGRLGAFAMMANCFMDMHNNSRVTPYFGGGIGFAVLHLSDTFGTDVQATVNPVHLYPSDDDTVFAYQAGAGTEISLNRQLSLDLGYRYFGTTKGTFTDGVTSTSLKYESHNVTVGLRVKF